MDSILNKLFKKYFIFKIQEDWKDELKKIPEELLKKWMDEDLFKKIDEQCNDLVASVSGDLEDKWNNELWMDINDFVNDYTQEQEEAEEAKREAEEPDVFWDTDDEEEEEVQLMYCSDVDENCNCDHSDIHVKNNGCTSGCAYTSHTACLPYINKPLTEESEISETQKGDPTPDESIEPGEVCA